MLISVGGPASQIGFHLARDYNPQRRISTATGLVNAGGFLGAMVGAILVGLVIDHRSGSDVATLTDYRWALGALAALGTSGCGSLSDEDDLNTRPSWLGSVSAASYDGSSDDLLTAGLGKTGLGSATAPTFATPTAPTAAELRRQAIHTT